MANSSVAMSLSGSRWNEVYRHNGRVWTIVLSYVWLAINEHAVNLSYLARQADCIRRCIDGTHFDSMHWVAEHMINQDDAEDIVVLWNSMSDRKIVP